MHLGALLAVLPLAAATVSFNGNVPTDLSIGSSLTLRWTTNASPVKILLVGGGNYAMIDLVCNQWINNDLSKACTNNNGEVTWTPGTDVPQGRYTIQAVDADNQRASTNTVNIGPPSSSSATSSVALPTTASSGTTGQTSAGPTNTSSNPASSQTSSAGSNTGGSSDNSSSGLSTGAKAGVGVGAAVGAILLLGLLGLLFFRMGKKAAAKKNKQKEDGSGGEEGDVSADGEKAGVAAAGAAGAKRTSGEDDKKDAVDTGPAEMPAPDIVHEAPDYKLRLDSPGGNAFVSELDATGGSFVLPSSRPSTAAGVAGAGSAANKVPSPTDADRPVTPQITVTTPEGENADGTAAAASSPKGQAGSEPKTDSSTTVPDATSQTSAAETSKDAAETSGVTPETSTEAPSAVAESAEKPAVTTDDGSSDSTPKKKEEEK